MKRKIETSLLQWSESKVRKPLTIHGARQVGKTYSVLKFGAEHFESTIHIDFSAQARIGALFEGDITPAALIPQLEVVLKKKIDPATTLIFFDEIQACPRALTSLKYFYEQVPEYYVIAAGSLLGVALGRKDYSFPVGKVDMLNMYPLDFEEYLWALGEDALIDLIRSAYDTNTRFALHDHAMDLYRSYAVVGGMPEVVSRYRESQDLLEVRVLQRAIIDAYLADMTKYASPLDSSKILNVWRSVPEQLAKENHKFQYSTIASSARAFQYEAPINWLNAAGLVTFCYRVSEGKKPLAAYVEHDFFKLYLLDTGLLSALWNLDLEDIEPADDKGSRFRGGLTENYVMQQLVSLGYAPNYWGTSSKAEVDFIIQNERGEVVPIEAKSGKNVTARSLESYRDKFKPEMVVRVSKKNFGFERRIKSVPLYAAFCLG